MEKQIYRKFRGVKRCTVIEVLEGDGTEDSPMEINSYVVKNGNLIGVFKNHELDKIKNEYN